MRGFLNFRPIDLASYVLIDLWPAPVPALDWFCSPVLSACVLQGCHAQLPIPAIGLSNRGSFAFAYSFECNRGLRPPSGRGSRDGTPDLATARGRRCSVVL